MIRCVISDLGRVIVHFDNTVFYEKIARCSPFSREKIAELTRAHFHLVKTFDRGEMTPLEFYGRVTETLHARIDFSGFYEVYNDVFSVKPDVLQTLKRLKRGYKLLLLSNTDVMRFGFIRRKFPEILIFDEYVLSYEVGSIKPEPQIYREALQRAGYEAQQCVFIDDIKENIEAAQRLGIIGVHLEPQTDLQTVLRELGLSF